MTSDQTWSGSCPPVFGEVDDGYGALMDAFVGNFDERGDVGAGCTVYVNGRMVVDLWAGVANRRTRRPWQPTTAAVIFSCTKGVLATCAYVLAQQGLLNLDAPIARYWPAFAQHGKEAITVREAMCHRAGLPCLDLDLTKDDVIAWAPVIRAIEEQAPLFPPDAGHCYHAMTYGWLLGEVIRRITGLTPGAYFRWAIGDPLGLRTWIGLPKDARRRARTRADARAPGRPRRLKQSMPERSGVLAYRPQLITYPDSLTSNLGVLAELLEGPLAGLFHGVHILPPFPSSGDRGFAPLTYREIDPRFGTWEDIARIAEHHDVLLDLMINHLSRQSREFRDFERTGRRSPYADLFITLDKIWPTGQPRSADIARIFRRRSAPPFSTITVADTGKQERVWTTFGTSVSSEQIDLDVRSPATRNLITDWLRFFASQRIRIVRLDAVGFVIKKAGTSCFMVDPEIYEFLDWIAHVADSFGLAVLPEVHDTYATHERVTAHGLWTYDFVLPGLVLHALDSGEVTRLADHLSRSPKRQFTTLDCHDGIPVSPDLDGILEPADMLALVDRVKRRGGNVNPLLSDGNVTGVDVHQLNCTYYSALDCDDDQYLIARAIQLFAPGIPQIYYVGLLAGANDHAAIVRDSDGRAINRHNYSSPELGEALQHSVVRRLLELVRLRNTHPAFDGDFEVEARDQVIDLRWRNGEATCSLHVDLRSRRATIADGRQPRLIAGPI